MNFAKAALLLLVLFTASVARAQETVPVDFIPLNGPCGGPDRDCRKTDALFFIHGIYGGEDTFRTSNYNWPLQIANKFGDRVDVYLVKYTTSMIAWAKKDIASFDEIAFAMFRKLHGTDGFAGLLTTKPYRSVGMIAHSLGGNFAAAYIHSVKSELGHEDRARNSFLITLGTPANGAQIANVGRLLKSRLGMRDPLLQSLERDNTFLRMMAAWRRSEDAKASRFHCRPVNLYVGIEGSNMLPSMRIVSEESAREPYRNLARDIQFFGLYDHSRMAKPTNAEDPLNTWVESVLVKERKRIDDWGDNRLCDRPF